MDVYFFFKQRTDLIRHFYDAASAPFVDTANYMLQARHRHESADPALENLK